MARRGGYGRRVLFFSASLRKSRSVDMGAITGGCWRGWLRRGWGNCGRSRRPVLAVGRRVRLSWFGSVGSFVGAALYPLQAEMPELGSQRLPCRSGAWLSPEITRQCYSGGFVSENGRTHLSIGERYKSGWLLHFNYNITRVGQEIVPQTV